MKTLAIIPARGGSKRIPRKNIKKFLGAPIIKYSIEATKKAKCFSEIMVSTDDPKIAKVAKSCGAQIPFLRSKQASADAANLIDVWEEVLLEYEKINKKFDYFCSVLATAPFISAKKIRLGFEMLKKTKAEEVVPVVKFSFPIQRAFKIERHRLKMVWPENMNKHSQHLMPTYHDSGQFYWYKVESFLKQKKSFSNNTVSLELPESEVQDIDTLEDWKVAEMKYRILKKIK